MTASVHYHHKIVTWEISLTAQRGSIRHRAKAMAPATAQTPGGKVHPTVQGLWKRMHEKSKADKDMRAWA